MSRRLFIRLFLAALFCCGLVQAQQYGLTSRPSFTAYHGTLPATAPTFSGSWSTVEAFPSITFLNALGITELPGQASNNRRMVVWEREGRVYSFPKSASANNTQKTLMLDISNKCQGWDDSGLLALAFHPGFGTTNRYVFIYYTWVTPGTVQGSPTSRPPTFTPCRDRLARFNVNLDGTIDAASETIFIDQVSASIWHNGGGMFFHPTNGFLYLTNGDDAQANVNTQRIDRGLYSGVLRIDVDQRGGAISHPIPRQPQPSGSVAQNYYIPNDNPFVGQTGVLEEFFAVGLRSPHRMTCDPVTGRIFIGDVGLANWEEIDIIAPGESALNFQWDRFEGNTGDLTPPHLGTNRRPAIAYSHSEGSAVIGGYVYRGAEFASDLGGKYIFGDNGAGIVWYLDESTTPATKVPLAQLPNGGGPSSGSNYVGLSSFGLDADNELYLCQMSSTGGKIFKLARSGTPPPALPATLSATGLMSNLATLTPATGFTAYDVINPLWSDRASKQRWFAIPDGQQANYAPTGDWTFPAGSVWLKHFDLPTDDSNPSVKRRLETRVLVRDANNYVYGMTYKWRADNSDADLVTSGFTEDVPITGNVNLGTITSTDIGGPSAGLTTSFNGGYAVTAGGSDIFGNSDQFRFVHTQKTGDFDIATRLESLTRADLYTKAGLMARESLDANARNVMALVFPTNEARNNNTGGYEFQSRDTTGGASAAIYPASPQPAVRYPNAWLRLKREGNVFTAYHSRDGVNWTLYATKTLALPNTVFFGMALTSHNPGTQATARFHFNINRTQPWYFPGRQDCLSCHTNVSGGVLGVNTQISNLSRLFTETSVNDNQLRAWNHAGYLNTGMTESAFEASIPGLTKMAAMDDSAASVEQRMRSYLDSNCAHCHRPGGVHAFWDARLETPLGQAGIVNGIVQDTFGISGAKVLVPDSVDQSVMYKRMATAMEAHKMPPLAKNLVDHTAIAMLEAWINEVVQPPADPLPSPWVHVDIGNVGFTGDATYQTSTSTFIMSASGADIEGNADAFHFTYQTLNGDGELIARVQSLSATDAYTKAGVMIRETLDAGSKNAFLTLMSAHGSQLQWRAATNGGTSFTDGPDQFAPYYVRIRRQGNVITGYIANTLGGWTQVGSTTIAMNATAYIGMAVTAHNNAQTATALFDNVAVFASGLPLAVHLNFQPDNAQVPEGYIADTGLAYGARGNGFTYGWNVGNSGYARDRNNAVSPDQRYDTFSHMDHADFMGADRAWDIAVPNGTYSVHLVCGDPLTTDSVHEVAIEGVVFLAGTPTTENRFIEATGNVTVTDGTLSLTQGPAGSNTKINFIDIASVASSVNVTLTSPAHQSTHFGAAANSIALAANASTTNGGATIAQVEFFDGFTSIHTDTEAPFAFTWTTANAGAHSIMAKATDSTGAVGFSSFNDILVSPDGAPGLGAEYWPNLTMTGTPQTRSDANIQFDWGLGSPMPGIPNDNFSVRWRGRIRAQFSETYTFRTQTDDGVRLWVNGQPVIDKWVNQGVTNWTGTIALTAGQLVEFEMHYFDNFGDAIARLFWSSPSLTEQIVPGSALFAPAPGTNHRPRAPIVTLPSVEGELADPMGIVMQTAAFEDVDAGQTHTASDWLIFTTTGSPQLVWSALNQTGSARTSVTLGNGSFESGFSALGNETNYQLRTRHKDNSGAANTEWSAYTVRNFTTSSNALPTGISDEYYSNDTAHRLVGTPVSRGDTTIDFFWNGSPFGSVSGDNFSVRWRARVRPQFSETYTFTTRTDDGARLWVNGQLLVDQWVGQAATEVSGTITLVAGQYYDLEMQYYDGSFDGEARLYWTSASQPKQIIPANRLHLPVAGANHRPLVPLINLPTGAGTVSAASVAMQSGAFTDQDSGHTHAATDWEIWTTAATPQRVWNALNQTGAQLLDAVLADGVFEGSLAGRATLNWSTSYQLRVRHKDSSGDANSEWSAPLRRNFTTTASPLSTWRSAEFTPAEQADPLISGDAADPDRDGMNNFAEYFFRLPPKVANQSPAAISSIAGDAIYFDFPVNVDAQDVSYSVETSLTLGAGTWTSVGITYQVLGTASGVQTIRARVPRDPGAKQFVRIHATSP